MRVEGEYINVNDLYGSVTDGSGGKTKGLSYNNSKVRYAEINGIVKYDHWITVLEAFNTDIPAKGGYVTDLLEVTSYGTDYMGVNHDMAYTIDPTSISANTLTSSKSHTVTIKQTDTGKSVSVTATQAGRVATKTTYKTPTVTSTSISTVPASGNVTMKLTVYWSQVKETTYDNDTTSTETVTGNSAATVTNGSSGTGVGAYISDGGVYVPSAGTTYYTSQRTAYTISEFTFTANGVSSGSVSRTVYVYQSANTRTSTTEYSVYCGVASPSSIANTGGTFSFSATCQSRPNYTYASGSTENGSWVDAKATVSYSNGVSNVSTSSFTGSATITATVDENIGDSRNPRVTVKATDYTSESDYTSVVQDAVSYEFSAVTTLNPSIDYNTSSFSVSVSSKRNGKAWSISKSDVTISNSSYASVSGIVQSSYPDYQYNVNISPTTNNGTSDRTYKITVTQPTSGKTLTFNVTQGYYNINEGAPSGLTVAARYGEWFLGTVNYGTTTGSPHYLPTMAILICKASAVSTDYSASYELTYSTTTPNGSSTTTTNKTISGSPSIASGAKITINGVTYHGISIASGTAIGLTESNVERFYVK